MEYIDIVFALSMIIGIFGLLMPIIMPYIIEKFFH